MRDAFARLETVNDLQILAEIISSDKGPALRFRRDDGVSCEITVGPWPDDPEGWEKAEKALVSADMVWAARQLDGMIADLLRDGGEAA